MADKTPPADHTPLRDRAALSARLWEIAEQHIVAEWICCEPLEPRHELCAKGYAALGMVKSLLVDADPEEAWNPSAPLLDAVLAVLPSADRAALLEAADVAERIAIKRHRQHEIEREQGALDVMTELRRVADEQPAEARCSCPHPADEHSVHGCADGCACEWMPNRKPAQAQGCWCGHPKDRHWSGATHMTFPDGCHDCRGWNGAHAYGQELPWLPEGDEPAAVAGQDGAQQT